MTIRDVARILEEWAPLQGAEDFDNVGLLVGDPEAEVRGILITLDTLEDIVEEAISKNYNLIISFHPILFKGLLKLTGKTYVERVVAKAIRHGIGIYAMHTALDNIDTGVNAALCNELGLDNPQILIPKKGYLKKLSTYVPAGSSEKLKTALFEAGAGTVGAYSNCSFSIEGKGSFTPGEGSSPTLGEIGQHQIEDEVQLQLTFPASAESAVLEALFKAHPYEEVAYELMTLENKHQYIGMGMIGEFEKVKSETEFFDHLKDILHTPCIRHSRTLDQPVKKVAVLGGSGAFAIKAAIAAGANALVTSDIKYHQFFEAESKIILVDVGHFESEQFTKKLIYDYLTKKMPNFAIALAERHTNPIYYY